MRQAVSERNKTRTERTKAGLLGPVQSLAEWVLATKKTSLLLKEPRAIIETSMAGVNDFIGLTNLKCCAPALLKGRIYIQGCFVRGVFPQKGKRVVWGCSALSCKPALEFGIHHSVNVFNKSTTVFHGLFLSSMEMTSKCSKLKWNH